MALDLQTLARSSDRSETTSGVLAEPRVASTCRVSVTGESTAQNETAPSDPATDSGEHFRADSIEELAFRFGQSYDSYLFSEAGRRTFRSTKVAGFVSYVEIGSDWFCLGGLIAAPADRAGLLDEIISAAQMAGRRLRFVNVVPTDVPRLRARGFEISKIGEEALIDLATTLWTGSAFSWVRRQVNVCQRAGITCSEVRPDELSAHAWSDLQAELRRVSQEHVSATAYGRELGLMLGKLNLDELHRRRLFVAQDAKRIQAFALLTPAYNGRMWCLELYRRRPSAMTGVMTALIRGTCDQLQGEGVRYASLCLCPALRCELEPPQANRFIRTLMPIWWKRLPWFYDARRLYHFKSRFRPVYRECYLAAAPTCDLLSIGRLLTAWGLLRPSFRRLPRHLYLNAGKWFRPDSLADPAAERYRRVDLSELACESASADSSP